jgi:hypothetical protein
VSCGVLWAGDTRKRLLANLSAYEGDVVMLTITAPGVDGVSWWTRDANGRWVDVPDWRAHRIPWADDTQDVADSSAATAWNCTAPRRWRELHRTASRRARRRRRRLSLLGRTYEYQSRGLLHLHLVLGFATAAEKAGAYAYLAAIEDLRERHGFGFVDRGRKVKRRGRALEVKGTEHAARYVAKYLSPLDSAGKPTISETVKREDVPANPVYVSRTLTARTGVTMRSLRRVRIAYFLGFDPATGETYASIVTREALRLSAAGIHPALGP